MAHSYINQMFESFMIKSNCTCFNEVFNRLSVLTTQLMSKSKTKSFPLLSQDPRV